jgi:hypothetical protein
VSRNRRVCRCFEEAQLIPDLGEDSKHQLTNSNTHMEMPSSLMMYPIPYPSAVTGPNPNNRKAGLPQFEVDKIDVFRRLQPGSVKMDGKGSLSHGEGTGSSGDGSKFPARSRCKRQ